VDCQSGKQREILIQPGADTDSSTLVDSVLDFSHRPVAQQPTEAAVCTQNLSDKGARIAAALRKKKGKSGAVDRVGGGGDAE